MLSLMRKHAASWFIKILLGAIVLVFVFWGVGSFGSNRQNRAVVVNGEIVTRSDWERARENLEQAFREYYKGNLDAAMLQSLDLPRQAMNRLVEQALLCQKAREMGFSVSSEDLTRTIAAQFRPNGQFDQRSYERFLSSNHWQAEEYESFLGKSLLADKMKNFIQAGVKVPENETRLFYDFLRRKVSIAYAAFEPSSYTGVTATPQEVEDHFQARREDYRTEAMVKADYVFIPFEGAADESAVPQEDVDVYYSQNPEEFSQEKTVEASHILIRLSPDASEDQVEEARNKAQNLADRARAGEDFAGLAKEFSEGPSAPRGGSLGAFGKKQMVPAFADAAFSMEPGAISDPVRTDFGFHVILLTKVNEARTRSLEEAAPEIRKKLVAEAAKSAAYDRINEVFDASLGASSLADAATAAGTQVKTADYFGSRGPAGLPGARKVADAASGLLTGEYTDLLELPTGYALFQVTGEKESRIPELSEVRDQVEKDATYEKRKKAARADAAALLTEASSGGDFSHLAEKMGVSAKTTEPFERGGQIPGLGFAPDIIEAAFDLTPADPRPGEPVESGGLFYVIQWMSQESPDPAGFETEKDEILSKLLERKKEQAVSGWLDALKNQAVIEVNQDLLPRT
ncbi:MAG: SurA N-terminal domain-containing protein [Pseudomonadota bacterium]